MRRADIKEMNRLRANILRLFRELRKDEQTLARLKEQCDHAEENGDSLVKDGVCTLCCNETSS